MVERIVELINANGIEATATQVNKNGIILDGIVLGSETVKPTLYVQDFNGSAEEIANKMIDTYNNLGSNGNKYANIGELVNDWGWVKDRLYAALMSSAVDGLVMKPYLDLNIYYRINIDDEASIKVTNKLMELWNITEDDLYSVSMSNTNNIIKAIDMMSAMMGGNSDFFESDDNFDIPMVVITNKSKSHGAIAMTTDIVGRIADKLDTDVYVIPSSVHECIVTPVTMPVNEVTEMILSVNETEVDPIEQLSNHAYIYRREIGEVECA